MGWYTIRRILLFLPNLLLVTILVYALTSLVPGSPVESKMPEQGQFQDGARIEAFQYEREYTRQAIIMGLDKPVFYFSVRTAAYPDTLHKIFPESLRKNKQALSRQLKSWAFTQNFHQKINELIRATQHQLPNDTTGIVLALEKELRFLREEKDTALINDRMATLGGIAYMYDTLGLSLYNLEATWRSRHDAKESFSWYLPAFDWHGTDNRYHHWLTGILSGEWGTSIVNGRSTLLLIRKALNWTLTLNFTALLGVLLISIPLGIYAAWYKGSNFDVWSHRIVYLFYSIPAFWLASLGITFLTSDTYGSFWHWFPTAGITNYRPDLGFFQNLQEMYPALFMPVIVLILPSLAYLFRQMRISMLEEMSKPYAFAARARGIEGRRLLWKVLFPNASYPIITMVGGAIPGLIAGSLIIEVIFSIPGMGRLMYESLKTQDWGIMFGVILIGTLIIMISYLITDLLYAWIDPKVKL